MSRTVQVLLTIMVLLTAFIVVYGVATVAVLLLGSLWSLPVCFVVGLIIGVPMGKLFAIIWSGHGA